MIAAIESDLRQHVRLVGEKLEQKEVFPPDVQSNAIRRWEEDHKGEGGPPPAGYLDLLDYTDFGDLGKILHALAPEFSTDDAEEVPRLANRLTSLVPLRNRVCHSRPLEPDDFSELYDSAREFYIRHKYIGWSELRTTLEKLNENPAYVLHLTIPTFWSVDAPSVPHNLPLPEFDDTGFLGRVTDRRELHRLISSPHPVVSVLGEGGVGKTALAVRCLYDLLAKVETSSYDAIIWISLKTKTLAPAGVELIRESISSTLGFIDELRAQLGVPDGETSDFQTRINETLEYLTQFKILLAIDNFETLHKEALRPLLSNIPVGSKVLITSRIGLGEIEVRYALAPLDTGTAVALARRYARTSNLKMLYEASDKILHKYCTYLFNNPLLIKWFISSVAAGGDPGRLLKKEGQPFALALRFCFENLFERLSPTEKDIIHILASARRPLAARGRNGQFDWSGGGGA